MINAISNWAGGIVIAVIIVTLLEMILPEGKNKKYIKTVLGIYLLFAVISPIIKAVSNEELNLENVLEFEKYMKSVNSTSIETSASIFNVYEDNLKKDIESKLQQKGYNVSQIKLKLEQEDEQNYGKIYEISVWLDNQEEKKINNTINKIENIEVVIGDVEEVKNQIPEKENLELKDYLSTTYDVEKDKISIF